MHEIREVTEPSEKSRICDTILRSLPDWFGIEQSIADYTAECGTLPMYAAFSEGTPIGFVAVKVHNKFTAEVCVMGVAQSRHRSGIGKGLIECCEKFCADRGIEFLTVKTLDESRDYLPYKKTRMFYSAMGFKPLEVFKTLWDENNPCLLMVKVINSRPKTS